MVKWVALGVTAVGIFLAIFLIGRAPASFDSAQGKPDLSLSSNTKTTAPTPKGETVMNNAKKWNESPAMAIDQNKTYTATIETSKGTMKVELFAKETPKTVNNFVFLAKEKFYDGVIFHRIMKGFMIQSGDPQGTGMGGPGYQFEDEAVTRDYLKGTLAMANSGPDTNGSQFFIMHQNGSLPKLYTIFGKIADGDVDSMKTLDAIAETPVTAGNGGERSAPTEKVTIKTVTIEEK